jgi:hypothetical protein
MYIVHFDFESWLRTRVLWRRALSSSVLPSDVLDLPASLATTEDGSFKGVDLALAAVRAEDAGLVAHSERVFR